LPCPGTDNDNKGSVLKVTNPKLETGAIDSRPGLLTFPQAVNNGYIQGFYPPFRVQRGDRFRSTINCEGGASLCYVAFRLDYQTGSDPIKTFWGPFLEKVDTPRPRFFDVDLDLSSLAGKDVKFVLTVLSAGSAQQDRALWVGPHIYRSGGSSGQADLLITSAMVDLQNSGCLLPDAKYGLRVSVANNGQAAAGSFVVKAGDKQETVAGLAVGETKTLFIANYVNPYPNNVLVSVDANNAIAESNEQNNSYSGPLPTPTQPLPCTVTPQSTSNTYQNTRYNFKFTLPTGATIASQSDTLGRVNLPVVTAGTNLSEKYVEVTVTEGLSPCAVRNYEGGTAIEHVTINNIAFDRQTGQGVATGNIYDWIGYSTVRNNACIVLAFILHSTNPANYPTPPPVFDMARETEVINTVMNSYSLITQ
jgi:hypothetical protein